MIALLLVLLAGSPWANPEQKYLTTPDAGVWEWDSTARNWVVAHYEVQCKAGEGFCVMDQEEFHLNPNLDWL